MSRPSSKTPLLIGIIGFALLGLVGLNVLQQKAAPKTEHEVEAEEAKQAAEAAKKAPSPPPRPVTVTPDGEKLLTLGVDKTFGPAKAAEEVTLGWEWTPEIQADPGKFYQSIEQISKAAPNVRIRVVNRDVDPTVPLGVFQGRHVIVPTVDGGMLPDSAGSAMKVFSGAAPPPPGPAATP